MKRNISLIVAMRSEASPLIESLGLKRDDNAFPKETPFESWCGKVDGKQISLTVGGRDRTYEIDTVGTQAATLMTWLTLAHFRPDLVINAGTAGGLADAGCEIGDVFLSKEVFCYHDRRIPLPRFREYGIGAYPSLDTTELAASLGFKRGRISTGDSLDMTETDLARIRENGAVVKEMEAAAVAWVCHLRQTPMFAVKVITDLIDRGADTEEQFLANLRLAVGNLKDAVISIMQTI